MTALMLILRLTLLAPWDLYGLGATDSSLAFSGRAVTGPSWAAAGLNPALVVDGTGYGISYTYSWDTLTINGRDAGVLEYRGTDLGIAMPLVPGRVHYGLTLHLPDQFMFRFQAIPPYEPRFILLDNFPHRLAVNVVVGWRWGALTMGGGVTVFMDLAIPKFFLDVGVRGGQRYGDVALRAQVMPRYAPVAGLVVEGPSLPAGKVRTGLSFRGEMWSPVSLDVNAHVAVPGVVNGDTVLTLGFIDHYTPMKGTASVSLPVAKALTLYASAWWESWSRYRSNAPDVKLLLDLGVIPPLTQSHNEDVPLRDTVSFALGARARAARGEVTAGYAHIPSILKREGTVFVDSSKHVFGVGFRFRGLFSVRGVSFDGAVAYRLMWLDPRRASAPNPFAPDVEYEGNVQSLTVCVSTSD